MKILLIFLVVILGITALSPAIDESINVKGENVTAVPENTSTPAPIKPSERALKASLGIFLLLNEEEEDSLLSKYSESKDIKEAITNLALFLDSDNTKLDEAEKIIFGNDTSNSYSDYDNSENSSDSYVESGKSYGGSGGSNSSTNKSLKYNAFNNSWEYAGEDENLKYNAFEDKWEYVEDDESPRYNAFEDKWEFAESDESTRYNAFEDKWEYASDDSVTRYNAFEDKWETTSSDSSLKYNAFENTWSYE